MAQQSNPQRPTIKGAKRSAAARAPRKSPTRPSVARTSRQAKTVQGHRTDGARQSAKRPSARALSTSKSAMVTRRRFILGTVGVGALAAAGAAAVAIDSQTDPIEIHTLSVPAGNVFTIDGCAEVSCDDVFSQVGDYKLPYGTLMWCNDDTYAACLIATNEASPLTQGAVLNLDTGKYTTILEKANGASEGFEIYDMRATSQGAIWTEANIFEGKWRVLAAPLSNGGQIGSVRVVDEGEGDTETPSIAAVGGNGFWVDMPTYASSDTATGTAVLKRAAFVGGDAATLWEATGRMACGVYAAESGVVIAPRNPDAYKYYQLVYVDGASGQATDQITLPANMRPTEVGYGPGGFSFCFESQYSYGNGIANMGTYAHTGDVSGGYDGSEWFRFARTPYAQPAWCGNNWLAVKSTQAVALVNSANRTYCTLDVPSDSTSWGDYLASTGTHAKIVTVTQVGALEANAQAAETDSSSSKSSASGTAVSPSATQYCSVRVWQAK